MYLHNTRLTVAMDVHYAGRFIVAKCIILSVTLYVIAGVAMPNKDDRKHVHTTCNTIYCSCVVLPCMLKHVQMKLLLSGSAHGNTLDLLKTFQHFKSAILPVNIFTAKAFTTPCITSELVITVGIFRIWPINSNLLRQFMYHTFSMVSRNVPTFNKWSTNF